MDRSQRDEFLNAFIDRWISAWNNRQIEDVIDLFHDEFSFDDRTFWPEIITDKDELRTYVRTSFELMPQVTFDEVGRFFDPHDTRAVVLIRQQGSASPRAGTTARFDLHACDAFLAFRDGLLTHLLSSYDMTEMLRQLQLLPPRNGRIGGAYHLSLLKASSSAGAMPTTSTVRSSR